MEKHKCKLCFKNFATRRALGCHMRSHLLNHPVPQKIQEQEAEGEHHHHLSSKIEVDESASSPSSSNSPSDKEEEEKSLFYGLRENPKRSTRLVDLELSSASASASVDLRDRESETESSRNPTRRRSKRTRKLEANQQYNQEADMIRKLKFDNKNKIIEPCSWGHHEPEPVSSISDNTTEEDGAYCLMMLSRDKWKRKAKHHHQQQEQRPSQQQRNQNQEDDHHVEDEEAEKSMEETHKSEEFKSFNNHNNTNNHKNGSKGKYMCETCKKVFKSYQALGGHRASHKKIRFHTPVQETQLDQENAGGLVPMLDKKVHECPVCFRVFSSGQALGGHKRTHVTGSLVSSSSAAAAAAGSTYIARSVSASASMKLGANLIDLNLPAPVDDDEDISQIESSAVSDAEFVNHVKTMN